MVIGHEQKRRILYVNAKILDEHVKQEINGETIKKILELNLPFGVYHATNEGKCDGSNLQMKYSSF